MNVRSPLTLPVLLSSLCLGLGLTSGALAQGLRMSPAPQQRSLSAMPMPTATSQPRQADYVVALVNSEPITNHEVQARLARASQQLAQQGGELPSREDLTRMVLERIILERAQVQVAKETGIKVDELALDEAEKTVARQNRIDLPELHRRLKADGLSHAKFREDLRQQILIQRLRERDVDTRVKVSESDIDQYLREQQSSVRPADQQINLAQILVEVPEKATAAQVASLQTKARRLLERARSGEDFAALVREASDAPDRLGGGQMGLRTADRYPELFVAATQSLSPGAIADLVRSDAGFHILKVLEKQQAGIPAASFTQHHARHILLRPGPNLSEAAAKAQLDTWRRQVVSKEADFADLAKQHSQDTSASQGGDLGWSNPGTFVPEFEEVLLALAPGEVSTPLVSRFGVHLIQLVETRELPLTPRQQRELVRNVVRERKLEEALADWVRETRSRAFVEFRDPPQ